jgi:hypothetical protein
MYISQASANKVPAPDGVVNPKSSTLNHSYVLLSTRSLKTTVLNPEPLTLTMTLTITIHYNIYIHIYVYMLTLTLYKPYAPWPLPL